MQNYADVEMAYNFQSIALSSSESSGKGDHWERILARFEFSGSTFPQNVGYLEEGVVHQMIFFSIYVT